MNNKLSLKNRHGHIRVIALIGVMILIGLIVGYRVFQRSAPKSPSVNPAKSDIVSSREELSATVEELKGADLEEVKQDEDELIQLIN